MISKGPRSAFVAKCFVGGLVYQGQQTTHFQESVFVGLAAESGKANKQLFSWNICVFFVLALVPQASKQTLGQTNTTGSQIWT